MAGILAYGPEWCACGRPILFSISRRRLYFAGRIRSEIRRRQAGLRFACCNAKALHRDRSKTLRLSWRARGAQAQLGGKARRLLEFALRATGERGKPLSFLYKFHGQEQGMASRSSARIGLERSASDKDPFDQTASRFSFGLVASSDSKILRRNKRP